MSRIYRSLPPPGTRLAIAFSGGLDTRTVDMAVVRLREKLGPGGAEIVLRGFDGPDPGGRGGPERVRLRFGNGRLVSVKREAFGGAAAPDARPSLVEIRSVAAE